MVTNRKGEEEKMSLHLNVTPHHALPTLPPVKQFCENSASEGNRGFAKDNGSSSARKISKNAKDVQFSSSCYNYCLSAGNTALLSSTVVLQEAW